MPYAVPQKPRVVTLERLVVGRPASPPVRWNDDLLFLTSYIAQPICSQRLPSISTNPTHKYYVHYRKRLGVKALLIRVEPNTVGGGSTRPALKCTVTASSGTVNWIGTPNWLDGSNAIPCPLTFRRGYSAAYRDFLDVSQLSDGTSYDLIFTITDSSGTANASRGLYTIHVTEVPLADVDPIGSPTSETGVNPAWLVNTDRNAIVDGTTASISYGTERFLNQLEVARYQCPREFQWLRPENTTDAWNTNTTVVGTAFPFGYAGTVAPTVRGRAVNGTATSNLYTVRVRYRTTTTQKPVLRFSVQIATGGATTDTTFTLPHSSGAWSATTIDDVGATLTLSLPCSGTGQEVYVTPKLWNNSAGTVYISQLALIESEV